MSLIEATAYSHIKGNASYRGLILKSGEFLKYVSTRVSKRYYDAEGMSELSSMLGGVAQAGFDSMRLKSLLSISQAPVAWSQKTHNAGYCQRGRYHASRSELFQAWLFLRSSIKVRSSPATHPLLMPDMRKRIKFERRMIETFVTQSSLLELGVCNCFLKQFCWHISAWSVCSSSIFSRSYLPCIFYNSVVQCQASPNAVTRDGDDAPFGVLNNML